MTDLPTKEEMASLAALIAEWEVNEQDIAMFTEHLKSRTAHKLKLETDLIPSLMASAGGIDKFTLEDGTFIEIKDELSAYIGDGSRGGPDNRAAAFAWLEEHGHGDVIKDEMRIRLGRGDVAKERAEAIIQLVASLGTDDYSRKRAVHTGTLQALLKEQLGEGVEVPKETFGVHQQRRAVIKLAK